MPTILIADDEHYVRLLIRETLALEQPDYRFFEAEDGPSALNIALREKPDIILLDILMPVMDGYAVCKVLRNRQDTWLIPIILITALKEDEDKVKGIEAGADDFLVKPFNLLELSLRVKSLLRIKQLHDELQRQYEEIRAANEELRRLSRLRDDLTNMIIHDMRTPLSSTQLGLQFVLNDTPGLPELQRRTLEIAYTSIAQLNKMVNDLLDISRLEQGKIVLNMQTFSLSEVIEAKFRELAPLSIVDEKTFLADLPQGLPLVRADRDLISRVLDNLLGNALRHAPARSTIMVQASLSPSGDAIQVSVHDEGRGIPAEFQKVIFERFRQLETKTTIGQGVGLGLAFCKMAVEAHNGTIWVESREGQGSTFHFTLPMPPDTVSGSD